MICASHILKGSTFGLGIDSINLNIPYVSKASLNLIFPSEANIFN